MTIYNGSQILPCRPNSQVRVHAEGTYLVYGLSEDETRLSILAPHNDRDLLSHFTVPLECSKIQIVTDEDTLFQIHIVENISAEQLDPVPIEVIEPQLSLRDQIKQYIVEELSTHQYNQGNESFEEADDFDIDDESEPTSPYEMPEMDEDYLSEPETPEKPPEDTSEPQDDTITPEKDKESPPS